MCASGQLIGDEVLEQTRQRPNPLRNKPRSTQCGSKALG